MKKINLVFDLVFIAFVISCALPLTRWLDPFIFGQISALTGKSIQDTWAAYTHTFAKLGLAFGSVFWIIFRWVVPYWTAIRRGIDRAMNKISWLPEPEPQVYT